jgi:hypothetical protein
MSDNGGVRAAIGRRRGRAGPLDLRAQRGDAPFDRAAIGDLGIGVQVALVLFDRPGEITEPLERAREVVEQDRLGVQRVRFAQQLGGLFELAALVMRVAVAEQRERARAIIGCRLRGGGVRRERDRQRKIPSRNRHGSRRVNRSMVDSAEVVTAVPQRIGHYRVLGLPRDGRHERAVPRPRARRAARW